MGAATLRASYFACLGACGGWASPKKQVIISKRIVEGPSSPKNGRNEAQSVTLFECLCARRPEQPAGLNLLFKLCLFHVFFSFSRLRSHQRFLPGPCPLHHCAHDHFPQQQGIHDLWRVTPGNPVSPVYHWVYVSRRILMQIAKDPGRMGVMIFNSLSTASRTNPQVWWAVRFG